MFSLFWFSRSWDWFRGWCWLTESTRVRAELAADILRQSALRQKFKTQNNNRKVKTADFVSHPKKFNIGTYEIFEVFMRSMYVSASLMKPCGSSEKLNQLRRRNLKNLDGDKPRVSQVRKCHLKSILVTVSYLWDNYALTHICTW